MRFRVLKSPRHAAFEQERVDPAVDDPAPQTKARVERRAEVPDLMQVLVDPGALEGLRIG